MRTNERQYIVGRPPYEEKWIFWPDYEKGKVGVKKGDRETTYAEIGEAGDIVAKIIQQQPEHKQSVRVCIGILETIQEIQE